MSRHELPDQRVTLITLGCRDLDRSKRFYRDWGWRPHIEREAIAIYRLHGAALALHGLRELADAMDRPPAELGTGAITLAQNFLDERGVDMSWQRATVAGARAIKIPQATSWGGYSGYLADPDGHVWELAHNPFWPLGTDGSLELP
jgi:uncharacterized glyoxalase superfamily protein PhnB